MTRSPETELGETLPDSIESGVSDVAGVESWQKLPVSALGQVIHVVVTGTVSGRRVWVLEHHPGGRAPVEFVGSPQVARELSPHLP